MRVMVIGSEFAGKNIFCRYLLNTLLCSKRAEQQIKGECIDACLVPVCLLDLDAACPEQALPGVVSCARYKAPLLGPAYRYGAPSSLRLVSEASTNCQHAEFTRSSQQKSKAKICLGEKTKEILLGQEVLSFVSREYCEAAAALMDVVKLRHSQEPVIVNTPGVKNGITEMINLEIMRIIEPTHVVHIVGSIHSSAIIQGFTQEIINRKINEEYSYNGGMNLARQSPTDPDEVIQYNSYLNYKFSRVPSLVKKSGFVPQRNLMKDVAVISYFSALWPQTALSISVHTCQKNCKLSFQNFAVLTTVEPANYLRALCSSHWVALCSVHNDYISPTRYGLPKRAYIPENNDMSEHALVRTDKVVTVLGWALVKGVDIDAQLVHLYVPGDKNVIKSTNTLALHGIELPKRFRSLMCSGKFLK